MFASKHFKTIFRSTSILILTLSALAAASPVLAEERTPEPDYCAAHGNAYFGSIAATKEMIDDRLGEGSWQVGQHYLLWEQTLDNGMVLQGWIHIIAVDEHGRYQIVEYYFLPECETGLTFGQFDDLLVDKFVNPVLDTTGNGRTGVFPQVEALMGTDEILKINRDEDDAHVPGSSGPSAAGQDGAPQVNVNDDDSGAVIVITADAGNIILGPAPMPQIP